MTHLLFAIKVTVYATPHRGDVFTGKSTGIQLVKKLRALTLLRGQNTKNDWLKSIGARTRDAKLETPTMASPTTGTETIGLFTRMFLKKEGALLLGKTIQKHANQLIKTCLA